MIRVVIGAVTIFGKRTFNPWTRLISDNKFTIFRTSITSPLIHIGMEIYSKERMITSRRVLAGRPVFRHWTNIRNKTLFNDKVPDVKRTIGTPAKPDKTIARLWMNQAVLHEEC